MTDQIAPSLATELEQVERFDFVPHGYYRHLSAEHADDGEWMRADDVLPLLTRAAALARAAEEWQRLHDDWWQNGGERRGKGNRLVDLAWAENQVRRALVSSEGKDGVSRDATAQATHGANAPTLTPDGPVRADL